MFFNEHSLIKDNVYYYYITSFLSHTNLWKLEYYSRSSMLAIIAISILAIYQSIQQLYRYIHYYDTKIKDSV